VKTSPADWFLIRQVLTSIADDLRGNEAVSASPGPISAEKMETFVSDIDAIIGG